MEIYLVRHGQTEFNVANRIQGWCDSPLTELGKIGAMATGEQFAHLGIRFDLAFCSTSLRTRVTAEMILHCAGQADLGVTEIEQLREYHFGEFEGRTGDEIHTRIARERGFASKDQWLEAYRHGAYNMLAETVSQIDGQGTAEREVDFIRRLQYGLQRVIGLSQPDSRVLVVSHGMAIVAILKAINPQAVLYRSLPNASVSLLRFDVFQGLQLVGEAGQAFEYVAQSC